MRVVVVLALLLVVTPAAAQSVHVELGSAVGVLVAGGRNPTGGAALIPTLRVSWSIPGVDWLDATYSQVPHVVTPYSWSRIGLIDANDVGLSVHPASRSYTFGAGVTGAPTYMRFCNLDWCYRQWVAAWGGEVHAVGDVQQDAQGRGLHVNFSARVLQATPLAWAWERADAIRWMTIITGGAGWVW